MTASGWKTRSADLNGAKLGTRPSAPETLTITLQPEPTALCPVGRSPLSIFILIVRGMGKEVRHTRGMASQGLGEGLGVLQHNVCRHSGHRGSEAVT